MYKSIIVVSTLLITSFFAYPQVGNDDRIQELEELLCKKMLVLSELGKKIDEKQKILESIYNDICSYASDHITKLSLKGEERKRFIDQSAKLYKEFYDRLIKAVSETKNVQGFLIRELINKDQAYPNNLAVQKFWELRAFIEQGLIRIFVEQYEACLQEIIQLSDELKMLKNYSLS